MVRFVGNPGEFKADEFDPRYHVSMSAMRHWLAVSLVASLAVPAAADTFGGFSGVDRPYLVNQDKVCTPLPVEGGIAKGTPSCQKASADVVAKLSIKDPIPQRGDKASFGATAASRTLTVTSKTGDKLITWNTIDPIAKIVEVYASQYDDRVAVAFTTRRMGKELTDIVAFDLGKPSVARPSDPGTAPTPTPTTTPPAPVDPELEKLVSKARKASGPSAMGAWKQVLGKDPEHSEALYRIAITQLKAKYTPTAIASLERLAASPRPDAIEWLVEARFDPAFAGLRSDPAFRKVVGLDRKPTSTYERLMGFGGQWEQTGTSCDKAEVRFTVTRDRVVRIRVITRCQGSTMNLPFKGTWRLDGDKVVLTFATKGKQVSADDEAGCEFETSGDEDALRCTLGRDLDFVVLPTRR
ncbi:MAG: hypothetical protein SFX73_08720 [Kofleriaceae bacterium]|nr:hypothetical protein [Kofleriaceae bacterium]